VGRVNVKADPGGAGPAEQHAVGNARLTDQGKAHTLPKNHTAAAPSTPPPDGALKWDSPREREERLGLWLSAAAHVVQTLTAAKICMLVRDLCKRTGNCYAGDGFFADALKCDRRMVQYALKQLQTDGVIIRSKVGKRRAIWPAVAVVEQMHPHVRSPTSHRGEKSHFSPLCEKPHFSHNRRATGLTAGHPRQFEFPELG
jgi:hypothetical protein